MDAKENMSPLRYYTEKQAEKLSNLIQKDKFYRLCNEIWKSKYKK